VGDPSTTTAAPSWSSFGASFIAAIVTALFFAFAMAAGASTAHGDVKSKAEARDGRVANTKQLINVARRASSKRHGHKSRPIPAPAPASGLSTPIPQSSPSSAPGPQPTPTPTSAPTPALLLDAGFESGLANWNTAGVGDVVPTTVSDIVRTGSKSAKVILTGSQSRSELILGGNGTDSTTGAVHLAEGDERYYAFSFYIESMVYGRPGAHNLIMQFKSDGTGSPNFGLQLWDYEGDDGHSGGRGLWSSGDAMDGDRFLSPLAERRWHDVVIHFRASKQGDGFYRVYLDGELVDSRDDVSMIRPDRSYAYVKNGLYRNGGTAPGTSEIRLDAARLGTSQASVLPG
jgi:polysaccharide lyase-like protein